MGGRLNLDGGTLNLDGGTLILDGGTRPPYNLSTAQGPSFFENYCNIFLPNIGEDQKKVLPPERGAPGTVP